MKVLLLFFALVSLYPNGDARIIQVEFPVRHPVIATGPIPEKVIKVVMEKDPSVVVPSVASTPVPEAVTTTPAPYVNVSSPHAATPIVPTSLAPSSSSQLPGLVSTTTTSADLPSEATTVSPVNVTETTSSELPVVVSSEVPPVVPPTVSVTPVPDVPSKFLVKSINARTGEQQLTFINKEGLVENELKFVKV